MKMNDYMKFSLTLFLICLISAAFLAIVYDIAEPRIIEQKKLEEKRAIEAVLPRPPKDIEKIEKEDLVFYKAKDTRGGLIAYVFIAQAQGYSSNIRTVVSLSPGGQIIAVKILEQQETPGIGSQILEEKFLNQFRNRSSTSKFDTVTGATISSSAVIESIKDSAKKVLKAIQRR